MSISQGADNCQQVLAKIMKNIGAFENDVAGELHSHDAPVAAQIPPTALPLTAACLNVLGVSKAIINNINRADLLAFASQTAAWSESQHSGHTWHIIHSPLSEQELEGTVITDLSLAYHQLLLAADPTRHFVIAAEVLETPLPAREAYKKITTSLTVGEKVTMSHLIQTLVGRGYTRHTHTIEPGSLLVRGETIDVSHPLLEGHYSLTLFGETIENIVHRVGQRSATVPSVNLPPMKFPQAAADWQTALHDRLLLRPEHTSNVRGRFTILTDSVRPQISLRITEPAAAQDNSEKALFLLYRNRDHIEQYVQDRPETTALLCQNELGAFPLHLEGPDWILRTEEFLFPTAPTQSASPISYERALELIAELTVGKPAVHADHGIGIYEGLQKRSINEYEKEYILLRYAEGDALSVPVEYAHKVSAYVGEAAPVIHRLGGTLWQKVRKKAQEDAAALARELITIAQERSHADRPSHSIKPAVEQELEATFPFELTDDQLRTWQEVQDDLRREHPMDRLVVGDVGFGKTEIALRAAYHVMASGKQVAVLAPTTLLVQQHFDTFQQRLPKIKDSISLLSRFVSTKEQKLARQRIADGMCAIAVGTHALLSNSTEWKNLGLVIIDEEQRFGVKQKEHFKKIRASVDVLSLSATPIPRTLSMALSGLRSLSLIATPPKKRKGIKTFVKKVSDAVITEAIGRELERGGQVYVVAPKIRHLGAIKEHVSALFPTARIAVAHGRLPDSDLSRIVHQFDAGEIDIMVSSSIVENGLDLPNANTMVVWHAPNFGLAELYQLRGRIGRRERQGYAYFFYSQERLTPVQRQRLTALTEASRLGSGWEIARRDLEMRGTGNLLGAQQSGSVNTVGLQLYLDLVNSAMETPQTQEIQRAEVHLPLSATLPVHFIQDDRERTRWYTRLSRSKTNEQLDEYMKELEKLYGPLPEETRNLMLLIQLQRAAGSIGISKITSQKISPSDEDPYDRLEVNAKDPKEVLRHLGPLGRWVVRGHTLTWDVDGVTPVLVQQLLKACYPA